MIVEPPLCTGKSDRRRWTICVAARLSTSLRYVSNPARDFGSPRLEAKVTSHASTLGRCAALICILATVYFFGAAIAAHIVSTQYNFLGDYISDYAVGPWGWIYGSAFWASCIGCIALAAALTQSVPPIALSRIGVGLLVIVGITYAIDFFFPTDILPPGAPPTTIVGTIHLLDALLGWVLFAVGALLVSSGLKSVPYWKPWRAPLTILAWLSVLLLFVLVAVAISKAPFGGLAEKAFILDRNVWALLLALLIFNSQKAQSQGRIWATPAER
jgi:Protein of unknown function (DUF998)